MKNYIGTKKVMAEPMNEITAVEMGYARPNEDNHEWREGYHVVYPDGYHSWSPKDVFEQAYKCAETHIDRMRIELDELTERRQRMWQFINSDKYSALDREDRNMLDAQFSVMLAYVGILIARIRTAEEKQENKCNK